MTETQFDNSNNPSSTPPSSETSSSTETIDFDEVLTKLRNLRPLETIQEVFEQYKTIIIAVVVILGLIIGVQVLLAVLQVINHLPLLAPTFEVIGIGFTIRYAIDSEGRARLFEGMGNRWEQVLGKDEANSGT